MTLHGHHHGHWPSGDRLGAGNLLTPERRLAALRLVEAGRVYELCHVIEMGAPRIEPVQLPYVITASATSRNGIKRRRAAGAVNDAGSNLERIEMTTHVGTHIDALGHFTMGDRMYGGLSAAEEVGDWGLNTLGIENAPPIVARGILLDVAGLDGGEHPEQGRAVTPDELAAAAERAGTAIQPGDVALIRTGWGRYYMSDNARYLAGEPGIDVPAAKWLTSRGVCAIGADNMAVEVTPNPDHSLAMPVHQHALVEAGVYLVENMVLDELARDGVGVFCVVLLPIKFKGATGCPVRLIAMV